MTGFDGGNPQVYIGVFMLFVRKSTYKKRLIVHCIKKGHKIVAKLFTEYAVFGM